MEEATAEEKNKAIYQELYENHDYHPTLGASYWAQLTAGANLDMMESEGIRKILDFGCGTGEGVRVLRNMGYDAYGVDISSNTKAWMENNVTLYCGSYDGRRTKHEDNEFDMVGCFEVMEHIPEELAEQTLREIYRIGNKHFAFTIALQEEAALIYGKLSFHVNLKPVEWWIDLLERIGFNLVNANEQIYNRVDGRPYSTLFVFASKTNSNLRCEAKWDDKCQTSNAPL
jgi:SAM-dependent methyltransferase